MSAKIDPAAVLAVPMRDNDAVANTIREYLISLLRAVWDEGEGFSGKRPFGNSSWEYDLYQALGAAGLVAMTLDEDGYVDEFTREERAKADALIRDAINHLGATP